MFSPLPQREREELLDVRALPAGEVRRSLHDIARINALTGADFFLTRRVQALLKIVKSPSSIVTILDIGTGIGAVPRLLTQNAGTPSKKISVVGLDINATHLQFAQEENHSNSVHFVQGDAFRLPMAANSVDLVVSTLFLHHFRPPHIVRVLREAQRVARFGVVMSDLTRSRPALWAFRIARPVLARSWITRQDAETSIRRGYTAAEMREIAEPLGFTVEEPIPFRQFVCWSSTHHR